jgi:hypothetical protein
MARFLLHARARSLLRIYRYIVIAWCRFHRTSVITSHHITTSPPRLAVRAVSMSYIVPQTTQWQYGRQRQPHIPRTRDSEGSTGASSTWGARVVAENHMTGLYGLPSACLGKGL